jgi:hypothetical protein
MMPYQPLPGFSLEVVALILVGDALAVAALAWFAARIDKKAH